MGYFIFLVKKRDMYSIKTALNIINALLVDILCVYSALLMDYTALLMDYTALLIDYTALLIDYTALLMGSLAILVHLDACSNESCHA